MTEPEILRADYMYTGGSIYLFWGTLSDNTFFIADGDMFDVRILDVDPDKSDLSDEVWQADWQQKHLIRDLNTESEGPDFILRVLDKIVEQGKENPGYYVDPYLDKIREDAEGLHGSLGWR